MKEKNADDDQQKFKLVCLFCKSENIALKEIVPFTEQSLSLNALVKVEVKRTYRVGIYHCKVCNRLSQYSIKYSNKISTTNLNAIESSRT